MVISEESHPGLAALIGRRADISERIWAHYDHAREKHPHFCDRLTPTSSRTDTALMLPMLRKTIKALASRGALGWDTLLECEKWEVFDAIDKGDTTAAVEECYDCIAVLLRVIDALEEQETATGLPFCFTREDADNMAEAEGGR